MKNLIRSAFIPALALAAVGCAASASVPVPDLPLTPRGKPNGGFDLVSIETRAGDGTPVTCFIYRVTHDVMSCVPHK